MRTSKRQAEQSPPKQHSAQLDFGYIKGFDDGKAHPSLTAIDIQSGMIMAIQLANKRMFLDYAVTQLQRFLIECGRTTHSILQSDQRDFLTSLITAVASKNGNIATRSPGAFTQGGVEREHRTLSGRATTETSQWNIHSRALDSSTQRAHHKQVRGSQQRMHKPFQQMEQRATHTTL